MHFDICSKKSTNWSHLPFAKSAFNLHCAIAKILVFHKQQNPWKTHVWLFAFREDENCFFWWDVPLRRCCFNSLMNDMERWPRKIKFPLAIGMRKAKIKRNSACRPNNCFFSTVRGDKIRGDVGGRKQQVRHPQLCGLNTTEQGKVGNDSTCCTHLTDVVKRSCVHCCGRLLPKPARYWGQGFGFRGWLAGQVTGAGTWC